jgi:hypothetical protein
LSCVINSSYKLLLLIIYILTILGADSSKLGWSKGGAHNKLDAIPATTAFFTEGKSAIASINIWDFENFKAGLKFYKVTILQPIMN